MGVVYAAYDPHLDRTIAVKLLRGEGLDADGLRRASDRLHREARAMAQLAHPHVVMVHEVGRHDGGLFLAMELVDGHSVQDWMRESARPYREVLRAFFQAGLGIVAAHRAGLVHRDLKPANILVGRDGRARVTDFGLARAAPMEAGHEVLLGDPQDPEPAHPDGPVGETAAGANVTHTGLVAGTPAYMAPELFEGAEGGPRADQFSYCVALYEALYGTRPYAGRTPFALLENIRAGRLQPPPRLSRVPEWLHRLLVRGLAADPAERHPTLASLLAAIAFTDRVLPG